MAHQPIQGIMQKDVTRKEFMGVLALGVGSIFGFGTIIKLLTGKSLGTHKSLSSSGYNSGGYGK